MNLPSTYRLNLIEVMLVYSSDPHELQIVRPTEVKSAPCLGCR